MRMFINDLHAEMRRKDYIGFMLCILDFQLNKKISQFQADN